MNNLSPKGHEKVMSPKKYRKGVFFLTYAKTKNGIEYLIFKRKLHWKGWEFSKGGKKPFETNKMAIKRELKEEVGIKPIKIKKFKNSGKYEYKKELKDRERFIGQTYKLYSVEIKKSKVKFDKIEHSDYKWVNFKEAFKKLTWPNQRVCLKIVDKWLANK